MMVCLILRCVIIYLEEVIVYVFFFQFTGKEMELRPVQFILRCGGEYNTHTFVMTVYILKI